VSISVPGVPPSRKTPGITFNVVLGGPGSSSGSATKTLILLGNMIGTAITGASPALSVAAGTATVVTPVFVASDSDAQTLFGAGSELHRMALAVFAQYPDASLYACPVADAGGIAASGVLTFTTTASAAYTVRLKLCGQTIDVPVASAATATVIAAAVADAINDANALPFTAQNSVGAVTVTAKQTGPRGGVIVVDAYFVPAGSTLETRITTNSTSSGAGTTGIWSSTSTLGGEITLTNGATQDSFANALAAINPTRYDRIVCACIDATNADLVVAELNAQAGPTVQLLEQAVMATSATYANAVTLATGRNASRMQVAWHHASVLPPPDVAAQVAAARLAGDAYAGGSLVGEASDPAANLDGVNLATVPMQRLPADRPTGTEIENALNNGLAVIGTSALRPGYGALVRSVTSRSTASGVPNYAVIDTAYVTVCDHAADDLRSYLATELAGAKLGADDASGNPVTRAPNVTTPSAIRSLIFGRLKTYESDAILRDVSLNDALLVVEADGTTPGRVNCEIPCEPITALHQVAGNVRQLASL
jgi:phage tail sheath gpL-like